MRHVREEEEAARGRVSVGSIEHHAEGGGGDEGRQFGARSQNQVHEGRRSTVGDQGSAAYGKE